MSDSISNRSGSVHLDAHAGYVVQRINDTSNITTISQLGAFRIALKQRSVDIVVMWVTIDETVRHDGVEGESPVLGRRRVVMADPLTPELL